jgi:hypothetical protein
MRKPEPQPPQPPDGCERLWAWFLELAEGRGSNGFGPSPLAWGDLAAWSAFSGIAPSPNETRLLLMLDRVYLAEMIRLKPKTPPNNPPPRRSR